jgi:hypothetical protein
MSGYRQYDAQKVVHRISHGPRFVALSLRSIIWSANRGTASIFVDQSAQLALESSNSSCSRFADANFA